jgi:hypothetical protein
MGTTRPRDIKGNDIIVGPWYWAQDRTLKILGAGRFAYVMGSGTLRFTMNGAGYLPGAFYYASAADPEKIFGVVR